MSDINIQQINLTEEQEKQLASIEVKEAEFEFKESVDKWKNRRRMAWISLWAGMLFPFLVLFSDSELVKALGSEFYLFVGTIVAVYIGAATWRDVKEGT